MVLLKNILTKIIENTSETDTKKDLESNLSVINNMIDTTSSLLLLIQQNLIIPSEEQIDEETVIEKSKGDIDNKIKIFNVAESLGFLGLGLALLGGKTNKKRKYTKKMLIKNVNKKC